MEDNKTIGFKGSISEQDINKLVEIVNDIEGLTDKKKELEQHITVLLSNAELLGFPKKILKKVLSLRRKPPEEIEEEEIAFKQIWNLVHFVPNSD